MINLIETKKIEKKERILREKEREREIALGFSFLTHAVARNDWNRGKARNDITEFTNWSGMCNFDQILHNFFSS